MYKKMHFTLFNAITDSLELLERGDIFQAAFLLQQAQCQTEELFLEGTDADEPPTFRESSGLDP